MQVDKEKADKEGWWYKPEYLFNELNINSAMASPAHGEVVKFLGKVHILQRQLFLLRTKFFYPEPRQFFYIPSSFN